MNLASTSGWPRIAWSHKLAIFSDFISALFFGRPMARSISLSEALVLPVTRRRSPVALLDVIIPTGKVLKRQLSLPAQVKSKWRSMAELDLILKTPFRPTDVVWVLILGPSSKDKTEQWIVKRTDLDVTTRTLRSNGYLVRRFLVATPNGPKTILDNSRDSAPRAWVWRSVNLGLVLTAIVLAGFSWLSPAIAAKREATQLSRVIVALEAEAGELRAALDQEVENNAAKAAFLAEVSGRKRLVELLHETTIVLPDTVWLSDWRYSSGVLRFNGEIDGSAPKLVLDLAVNQNRWLPSLEGPTSRTFDGKERFELVVGFVEGLQ